MIVIILIISALIVIYSIFLLFKSRKSPVLYRILLGLYVVTGISIALKVLHLPGGIFLSLFDFAAEIILIILLFKELGNNKTGLLSWSIFFVILVIAQYLPSDNYVLLLINILLKILLLGTVLMIYFHEDKSFIIFSRKALPLFILFQLIIFFMYLARFAYL